MPKKTRVAIIGRANVGKSTLFNRLTSGSRALVSSVAGTTRDRKEGACVWHGRSFTLVDTGGLDINPHDTIEQKIAEQARAAVATADLILFMVDSRSGITTADREIAALLRTIKKPIILIANKADKPSAHAVVNDFYKLGFGKPWPIAAISGVGTGDLLDEILVKLKPGAAEEMTGIRVAIVGRPNVGKSSLINALVGEDRSIVSDEPYTTRDSNDILITYHGEPMILVDTAGVRRKARISRDSIESESVDQSLASIRKADVVLLVTESHIPITAQDRQLAKLAEESRASLIIIGNKWDQVPDKDAEKAKKFEEYYHTHLNYIDWAPVILMSAMEKTKLTKLKETIKAVYAERFRTIDENALGKFLKVIIKKHPPVKGRGTNKPFIYRLKQVGTNPPQFEVHIKADQSLNYTYLNYIRKELRAKFGFKGTPLKMWVVKH